MPEARHTAGIVMPNWLAQRAAITPHQPALTHGRSSWTFAEFDRRASAMARHIAGLGAHAGDRVALLLRNSLEFAAIVHAAPRAGVVLVPLNMRLTAHELAWQLADIGARLLLHDQHTAPQAAAIQELVPDLTLAALETTASAPGRIDPADLLNSAVPLQRSIDLSAVATVIYTSGTTGRPKGALLTYGNHWWSAVGSAFHLGAHTDDRWLAVLPLFHVGGLAILIRGVVYGIPVIIHDAFDPAAVNQAIDQDGVTLISVVSAMLQRMLDARGEHPYPATLRCVLLGGGPAAQPLLDRCTRRGIPIAQTYGLTEAASQVATLAPADAQRKPGSAGKPLLPTELRIDRDGVPAAAGEVGEIIVRGPTVMAGYANRPDATARTLRDGWLRTGDLGYLDDEGYLYIVNRRDDLIISGGENVYPAEIEAVLVTHPAVQEACVVGVPDVRWGQVPAASITVRPGSALDEAAIISFCKARLAPYKVPRYVQFLDALPRNAAGKILRSTLRETFMVHAVGVSEQLGQT